MTPYLSCQAAEPLLEPFVDDELPMAEQVAVESHLRWCRVCEARVDDFRLIATSMRGVAHGAVARHDVGRDLSALRAGVLARVRAERDQSVPVRARQLFADMRLLWPALGASAAVLTCIVGAGGVFQAATRDTPQSLAGIIALLANPGSDENPLVLDGRVSAPRAADAGVALDGVAEDEAAFAFSAVVTREGRVSTYKLLFSERAGGRRRQAAELDQDAPALLEAISRSRFEPAQDGARGPVAVNVVWLVTRTTVKASLPETAVAAPAKTTATPAMTPAEHPGVKAAPRRSSTA